MKLEHFGMAEPGDCRVVFSAAAEELEAAVQAEKAAPDAPQDEDDLLTAAVNRAILEGFSPLFAQLMKENDLQPVTDPDFELLAVNRAEGFRAGVQFFCLPPLELGEYTGFTQPIQPRPIRELTIELEINRRHGDEDRAADAEGKRALRAKVTQDIYAQRCQQARAVAEQASSPSWVHTSPARCPSSWWPATTLPSSASSICGCRPTASILTST